MTKKMKTGAIALLALAFTLAAVLPARADDQAAAAGQDQKPKPPVFRTEIIKLKYVRAQDIESLLRAYVMYGSIQVNPNLPNVLTVRETPESLEKILAAARELDVKPADVLYTVQLVMGSEADAATDAELKGDPIIRELGKLLRYKGYTLLDATMVRSVNLENSEVQFGPKAEFQLQLRPEVAGDAKMPVIKSGVRLRQIRRVATSSVEGAKTEILTLVESTLNIKSGDRTVVGVSKLDGGDKGLILIISAKIVD